MIRLIGVVHLIEQSIDVLKKIKNLKTIDFKDLVNLLKSSTNHMTTIISLSTVDKAIQINNYFLLNKIFLTKYDLDSLNDVKRVKTIESIKVKTPIIKITHEDKATETVHEKSTVSILSANKRKENQDTNRERSSRNSDLKLYKSDTNFSIKTYDTFLPTPTPALLTDRTYLDRETNILETPPSLLELLYLEQIRKKKSWV